MTKNSQRTVMLVIAAVLVVTLFGIAISLSQDDRSAFGTIGLWLQVVGAAVMIVGLGLMMRERWR